MAIAAIANSEAGSSVRTKLNDVIDRINDRTDTNSAISASVTQTQGGGTSLTLSINVVSTVTNDLDAITADGAGDGREFTVINNGANRVQLFPAVGDSFNGGAVNLSVYIEPNQQAKFVAQDSTVWQQQGVVLRTVKEIAKNVTPKNYAWDPGWVKRYGALGGDVSTGDPDTQAFQNAIDAGNPTGATDLMVPVRISEGYYHIQSKLLLRDVSILGTGQFNSVRLRWSGTAGGTMFEQQADSFGSPHGRQLEGFTCTDGTTIPDVYFDFLTLWTGGSSFVDQGFVFNRVAFQNFTKAAIIMGGWWNTHWTQMRFDNNGGGGVGDGYCIDITQPNSGQFLGSFSIDGFTWDHREPEVANPGQGFLRITTEDNTNLGTIELANARMEINDAMTGDKCIVCIRHNLTAFNRAVPVVLRNVSYQDVANHAGDSVLFRDTADTSNRESLTLINFKESNLDNILGGTWPSNQYLPTPKGSYAFAANSVEANVTWSEMTGDIEIRGDIVGRRCFSVWADTDTEPFFELDSSGVLEWGGGGASAVDVNLYRDAANELKTDDKFMAALGIGVGNSAANTNAIPANSDRELEIFDADGNSLGFIALHTSAW